MSNHEEQQNATPEANRDEAPATADQFLKQSVDKESVVSFIEGMVQAMGSAAINGGYTGAAPAPKPQAYEDRKGHQSKTIASLMHKVERANKYPDVAKEFPQDALVLEWLSKPGCKQKEYFEEFECAEALTSFFASRRHFELAAQTASKALNITKLHRRDDEETLSELYWVLADLYAAMDKMPEAMNHMQQCLNIIEPGANQDHPTYKELVGQLNETRNRSLGLVTA